MRIKLSSLATHTVLIFWSLLVMGPLYVMLVNSLKIQRAIFDNPYSLPASPTFEGYTSVWVDTQFGIYFRNSLIVTLLSLFLIMFLGSMAAYALSVWRSRTSNLLYLFFLAGLMIPIRLGTINIFQIILALRLNDTIWGLIPVYVSMGLPIATFVLVPFIRSLPDDLLDAARIDGASEWLVYRGIILPIIRPALATIAIFNLIPIWNDLWFPLIFIRAQEARTVTYGVSLLFGQFQTDWTRILATLTLAALPLMILYLLMSRQFIKGLTAGAVKG